MKFWMRVMRVMRGRGLVLGLLLSMAGGGVYGLADLPLVNTETLNLDGIESLALSYGHDELILRESESEDLVIKEYMTRDRDRYRVQVSRSPGTLRIRRGGRPWLYWNWKARAEIYLPRSFQGNLRIASGSGILSAETDLHGYKTVDINVTSGKVSLNGVSGETVSVHVASGELGMRTIGGKSFVSVSSGKMGIDGMSGEEHHIKVTSGRLRVGSLEGQSALELSSGTIAVDQVRGGVEARVSSGSLEMGDFAGSGSFGVNSGNLRVNLGELPEDLRFRLSSGSVELGIPRDIPFNLDTITNSGNVRINEGGKEVFKISGNSTVLRPIGTGAERIIFALINSGNLVINRR
ncbi:MAG: DUF4097 domain-containing protein [Treponema sp.]|nr:DUF4097 domain-containing protein [Treponema sp.]